jgi:hypothetical protein
MSDIGIDDTATLHNSSAEFLVFGDNNLLYKSSMKYDTDMPESIIVDVSGVKELKLVTTEGNTNGNLSDATDWANARLVLK